MAAPNAIADLAALERLYGAPGNARIGGEAYDRALPERVKATLY